MYAGRLPIWENLRPAGSRTRRPSITHSTRPAQGPGQDPGSPAAETGSGWRGILSVHVRRDAGPTHRRRRGRAAGLSLPSNSLGEPDAGPQAVRSIRRPASSSSCQRIVSPVATFASPMSDATCQAVQRTTRVPGPRSHGTAPGSRRDGPHAYAERHQS